MNIDFKKYHDGLAPALYSNKTHKVLMLGFMNEEALKKLCRKQGYIFCRSKKRLWTKGEKAAFLLVKEVLSDCDNIHY